MKIGEEIKYAATLLEKSDIRTARLDALILLEHATGKDRPWLLAHQDESIDESAQKLLSELVQKRSKRIPLPQLTGKQEFWGLEFKITPDVLIPRPESEKIVEFALEFKHEQADVLDVGTGCGCIAIALAKERPDWKISAGDVSHAALKIAQNNAQKHSVAIDFHLSNLLNEISGKFDVITANLPYVRIGHKSNLTPEATKEPAVALFGGPDGLDLYRQLFKQVPKHSKIGTLIIVEADPWQHAELIRIAKAAGFSLKAQDRFVLAFDN
jgi:release factor glutamine methyltransferase